MLVQFEQSNNMTESMKAGAKVEHGLKKNHGPKAIKKIIMLL